MKVFVINRTQKVVEITRLWLQINICNNYRQNNCNLSKMKVSLIILLISMKVDIYSDLCFNFVPSYNTFCIFWLWRVYSQFTFIHKVNPSKYFSKQCNSQSLLRKKLRRITVPRPLSPYIFTSSKTWNAIDLLSKA